MQFFLSDFLVFKVKREEIKNNNFKNNGKSNRILFTQNVLKPRDQKQEM